MTLKNSGAVIKPGTRIRFINHQGRMVSDTVRQIFWQETIGTQGLPNGKPESGQALVLTQYSWIWTKDVKGIEP